MQLPTFSPTKVQIAWVRYSLAGLLASMAIAGAFISTKTAEREHRRLFDFQKAILGRGKGPVVNKMTTSAVGRILCFAWLSLRLCDSRHELTMMTLGGVRLTTYNIPCPSFLFSGFIVTYFWDTNRHSEGHGAFFCADMF
jgi:hypothetical protein